MAYYPKAYKDWVAAFTGHYDGTGEVFPTGPLRVAIECVAERPRTSKLAMPAPDVDNYAKAVLDGLTKCGIWTDDKQVQHLIVRKRWATSDEDVGIHITIEPV